MIYRELGRTGFKTSALGLGGESALYKRSDRAVNIIEMAVDLGINYFDTAPLYQESELNYGDVLPRLRNLMFIATKTDRRDYDGAWRQFEQSLRRLRVDRVDLLQIHHLDDPGELDEIFSGHGVWKMVEEAKAQKLASFVGITGHRDPDVLITAMDRAPFDTILLALNPADIHVHSFMPVLEHAVGKNMGIMAMKVLARGLFAEKLNWSSDLPIRYTLSLPVSNAVIGVMNEKQLARNADIVSDFRLMSEIQMRELETETAAHARELNFYRKGNEDLAFPAPPHMVTEAR
jgi:aryl-alcohol dehydrogenase-like predicted oxidoreductase